MTYHLGSRGAKDTLDKTCFLPTTPVLLFRHICTAHGPPTHPPLNVLLFRHMWLTVRPTTLLLTLFWMYWLFRHIWLTVQCTAHDPPTHPLLNVLLLGLVLPRLLPLKVEVLVCVLADIIHTIYQQLNVLLQVRSASGRGRHSDNGGHGWCTHTHTCSARLLINIYYL